MHINFILSCVFYGPLISNGFDVELSHSLFTPNKCTGTEALLILIHSAPDHADFRSNIRSTWAKGPHFKLVFLIGRSTSRDINVQVENETSKSNDILHYNLPDMYQHLTTKHVFGYRWAVANCPDVKYVLKSDDDGYVDTYHLGHLLSEQGFGEKEKFLLCSVLKNVPVQRSIEGPYAKWSVKHEDFLDETYPNFCSGHAYVTTIATIKDILNVLEEMDSVIHIDDVVVTGIATNGTGIPFFDLGQYFLGKHFQYRDELLDPHSEFFTPELMIFFDIEPNDITVLHKKFSWCMHHINKCYHLLWNNKHLDQIRRCQKI